MIRRGDWDTVAARCHSWNTEPADVEPADSREVVRPPVRFAGPGIWGALVTEQIDVVLADDHHNSAVRKT
jgi:hypothetical protein